jgi:hypothetical protein
MDLYSRFLQNKLVPLILEMDELLLVGACQGAHKMA